MIKVIELPIDKDMGGLTSYVLQLYRMIDKKEFELTLLSYDDPQNFDVNYNVETVSRPYHIIQFYKKMKCLLSEGKDIIHFHQSYVNIIPILIAKLAGFKTIILHTHSSSIDDNRKIIRFLKTGLHKVGRFLLPYLVDTYIGCSTKASEWMFPRKCIDSDSYYLLHNAIDLDLYDRNINLGLEVRQKFNIPEDALVVGHIGRFTPVKNHPFIIDIFKEVLKQNPNSYLFLLGDGVERHKIESLVKSAAISDKVIFMGYVNNTVDIMQAIDIMILPSLFEGLPLIAIESQALGIPILVSDTITQEVVLTDLCRTLPIDNPKPWAYEIISKFGKNKYIDYRARIKELGYDSSVAIKKIENIYKEKQ